MTMDTPALLSQSRLEEILHGIAATRVGVIGDVCLDLYWHADMTRSALSRETPHFPLPIVSEKAGPGAAGNVACNVAELCKDGLCVLGVLGTDWRGDLLAASLEERGIAAGSLLRAPDRWTDTYIKPMRSGFSDVVYEDPRLDFENHAPLSEAQERMLVDRLRALAPKLDVLCVCDQMANGCITPAVREAIGALGKTGLKIVVDSRNNIGQYRHVIVKPNDLEAAKAVLGSADPLTLERLAGVAVRLSGQNQKPALITVGERGCLLADGSAVRHIPACPTPGPHDICGAGDTFMALFALAYGAGADLTEAVFLGNMAASVTIRKIGTTGTASAGEIRGVHARWQAVYGLE